MASCVRGWALAAVTVPAGVLVAAGAGAVFDYMPGAGDVMRPEWERANVRRQQRAEAAGRRRADKTSTRPDRAPDTALGGWLGGDLTRWHAGRYLVLPAEVAGLPRLVVGASGSGKSVLLVRETLIAGRHARRVVLVDCKGDAAMREQAIAAYLRARPDARVLCWPGEALDGWRGDPSAQLGRLLQVWNWPGESAWYGEVANTVLRLALEAPGLPPVSSSGELMARLAPGHLQRLWDSDPDVAALLRDMRDDLAGANIRVLNLLASLGGSLDGRRSWSDADLIVCSVPVMANPKDADAAVRVLLSGHLAHHVAVRKPYGEPETVIVDELVRDRGRPRERPARRRTGPQCGHGEHPDRAVSGRPRRAPRGRTSDRDVRGRDPVTVAERRRPGQARRHPHGPRSDVAARGWARDRPRLGRHAGPASSRPERDSWSAAG